MKSMALNDELWATIERADESGVRLEMVMGTPSWEAMPGTRHQVAVKRIESSIDKASDDSSCQCATYQDIYVLFPDGSYKRPDISIYCRELPLEDGATTEIPAAVVEVISKGSEAKDLQIGPPFYLSQGVLDVVVFNPYTNVVSHFTKAGSTTEVSPREIRLQCGCRVTV
jgi:Uma2 family endonuclease